MSRLDDVLNKLVQFNRFTAAEGNRSIAAKLPLPLSNFYNFTSEIKNILKPFVSLSAL